MPNPGRILLVEDDPCNVELAMAVFTQDDLSNEVVVVKDGAEALDYLHCREKYSDRTLANPVVVLLDLNLPKMSGLDVLRQIKSDEKLKRIPVVMLTTSDNKDEINEAYAFGANAYIVKPVNFEKFINAIKEIGIFWMGVNEPPSNTFCEK